LLKAFRSQTGTTTTLASESATIPELGGMKLPVAKRPLAQASLATEIDHIIVNRRDSMKRGFISALTIIALSIFVVAQTTKNKGESKAKPQDQAAPPSASINPGVVDFKDQVTKKPSKPQRITVTNTGGRKLYINSALIEGDNKEDFTIINDTCTGSTIGVNKSCIMDIVFTPAVNERRKGELKITDNATDSPQKVPLIGNGINSVDASARRQ
jgi:hypothetical protein